MADINDDNKPPADEMTTIPFKSSGGKDQQKDQKTEKTEKIEKAADPAKTSDPAKAADPAKTNDSAKKPISLAIKDLKVLYTAYMPFLVNGGLFIPTKKSFEMGEVIPLIISLLDDPTKYSVEGRVVWFTPINNNGRTPGIGVQFDGASAGQLSKKIEQILLKYPDNEERTNTM